MNNRVSTFFRKTSAGAGAFIQPVSRVLNNIAQVMIVAITLLIVTDVILRYVFHRPMVVSQELISFMLVLLIFFALAKTQFDDRHVTVDIIVSKLPSRWSGAFRIAGFFLAATIFAFITWRSFLYGEHLRVTGTTAGLLLWPLYPFVWLVAIASGIYTLTLIIALFNAIGESLDLGRSWLYVLVAGLFILVILGTPYWIQLFSWSDNRVAIGILGLVILMLLFFSGMQVGPAMFLVAFLGMICIVGYRPSLTFIGSAPFNYSSKYEIVALPLYILMGEICYRGGLGEDVFNSAYKCVGQYRGGLAITSVAGCTAFAALSGSTMATAITVGKVAMAEMDRHGYDKSISAGTIAAAGTIGLMIPPSSAFIVFAFLTGTSVGGLFMAGIIPGLVQALLYILLIIVLFRIKPGLGSVAEPRSWKEKIMGLQQGWPIIALLVCVLGSIYFGLATPIEAAGLGVFGAFIITLLKKRMSWTLIKEATAETNRTVSMMFAMLVGGNLLAQFTTASNIPFAMTDFITQSSVDPLMVIIGIFAALVVWGMFLPLMPLIFVLVPIIFPFIIQVGYSPLWFGVLVVMASEIGAITPPFGVNIFAMSNVFKIPLENIFKGVFPFLMADIVRVVLIIAFPIIATFLPAMMSR